MKNKTRTWSKLLQQGFRGFHAIESRFLFLFLFKYTHLFLVFIVIFGTNSSSAVLAQTAWKQCLCIEVRRPESFFHRCHSRFWRRGTVVVRTEYFVSDLIILKLWTRRFNRRGPLSWFSCACGDNRRCKINFGHVLEWLRSFVFSVCRSGALEVVG